MRLLSLGLTIPAAGVAGAILIGGAATMAVPAGLVLLLLPGAGLGALLKGRAPPEVGLLLWSVLVILGAPLWMARDVALAEAGLADLDAVLPALHRPGAVEPLAPEPPPESPVALAAPRSLPPPPVDHDADDLVVLPYEGSARSMLLSLSLESEDVVLDTEMVFDTGATLTTISPALLSELELEVPDDAPTIQLQTANGVRSSPLLLLDTLWLGGFAVEGVTVTLCDNCGDLNGLIGLNVSSMFRVEVDQQARELTFHPEDGDRHLDISLWLSHSLLRDRGALTLRTTNRASRTVRDAVIEGICDDAVAVSLPDIPPGETVEVPLPASLTCRRPKINLIQAVW